MKIQENISLAPYTTLRVGGAARYFIEGGTEQDVKEALDFAAERRLPLFVLGGGSNLVVADEGWPGVVLRIALRGVERDSQRGDAIFQVAAGENWDEFVARAVQANCAGLECLSGIPGSVGGTPVQNVGAYGQEVSQRITSVRVLEIASGTMNELPNESCGFAYRTSAFNTNQRNKYIVLKVGFRLTQDGRPTLEYADLRKHFAGAKTSPTLQQVRDAVRGIRQSKAMLLVEGDEDSRSAGSFFKNPVVSVAEAKRIDALAGQHVPGQILPQYPSGDGRVKLAAAWLIEQSGFAKGFSKGPVGISRKHSLAIVNRGGATARDIVALKNEIQARVFDVWGIRLEPEPVFVGFDQAAISTS